MKELSRHDAKIKEFVETDDSHNWVTNKFSPAPKGFNIGGFACFLNRDSDEQKFLTIHPDAWDIDFYTHVVSFLEVVDQNQINSEKVRQIYDLCWMLDGVAFGLELVVYDMTLDLTVTVDPNQMWAWAVMGGRGWPWRPRPTLPPVYEEFGKTVALQP